MARSAAFQHAPPQSFPALYPHGTTTGRYTVARPCAAVEHQGIQGPVRIGAQLDFAVPADQNRHLMTGFAPLERSQSGIQQTLSLFGELHSLLIAIPDRSFTLIGGAG